MARHNIVPKKLALISRKDYNRARFAVNSDLQICQIQADKIVKRYARVLWERWGVSWSPHYDPNAVVNRNARREGQFIGDYTMQSARNVKGYHSIRDVITNINR